MKVDYLVRAVENKKWVWFKNSNNYLQLDEGLFRVFEKLQKGDSYSKILQWCTKKYHLTDIQAKETIDSLRALVLEQQVQEQDKKAKKEHSEKIKLPKAFYSLKCYRFNSIDFRFFFGNVKIETQIHPLFAHLEISISEKPCQEFKLFSSKEMFFLNLNGETIGSWAKNEDHVFKGQIFMALLNLAYRKTENDWLGVLHASAIGQNGQGILFLGDSGNGKSTASAIALANGFTLLADDFVPLDTAACVLNFPAAISVKKQALEMLSKRFPELLKAKEYELKSMNKTVRYLAPQSGELNPHPIKALVFIKYAKEIVFEIQTIDRFLAFQKVVTEAWLSPEEEKAHFFLDWISKVPIFQISYSDNLQMLDSLHKIFNDEY
jgi:hypothetical protein